MTRLGHFQAVTHGPSTPPNYRINSASPWTSFYDQISLLMKNDSLYIHMLIAQPAINLAYWHMVSSQSIRLKAGDWLYIQHSNSSTLTETCQAGVGGITITRIGS